MNSREIITRTVASPRRFLLARNVSAASSVAKPAIEISHASGIGRYCAASTPRAKAPASCASGCAAKGSGRDGQTDFGIAF